MTFARRRPGAQKVSSSSAGLAALKELDGPVSCECGRKSFRSVTMYRSTLSAATTDSENAMSSVGDAIASASVSIPAACKLCFSRAISNSVCTKGGCGKGSAIGCAGAEISSGTHEKAVEGEHDPAGRVQLGPVEPCLLPRPAQTLRAVKELALEQPVGRRATGADDAGVGGKQCSALASSGCGPSTNQGRTQRCSGIRQRPPAWRPRDRKTGGGRGPSA